MVIKIIVLIFFLSQVACQTKTHHAEFFIFGTMVSIEIHDKDHKKAEQASLALKREFDRLHHEWHAWQPGGLLAKINQAIADGQAIKVPHEVLSFIQQVKKLSTQSNFYFNPAIGKLIALWGFHSEIWQGPPPSPTVLTKYIKPPINMQSLTFEQKTIRSSDPRVKLDFGAVAKGYALDIAIEKLKKSGIKSALVNAGGDLKVLGQKQQKPWRIGIRGPNNQVIGSLDLAGGEAVVTSGNYERKFSWQGKSYHHIINPFTGWPTQGLQLVTVIHPNAQVADAAATAIMVAGVEKWAIIAQQMGVEFVLLIDEENQRILSPKMQERLD